MKITETTITTTMIITETIIATMTITKIIDNLLQLYFIEADKICF